MNERTQIAVALVAFAFAARNMASRSVYAVDASTTFARVATPKGRKHHTFGQAKPAAEKRGTREKGAKAFVSSMRGWKTGLAKHIRRERSVIE